MKQFYLFYSGDKSLQQLAAKSTDVAATESLPHVVAKSAKDVVVDNVIL